MGLKVWQFVLLIAFVPTILGLGGIMWGTIQTQSSQHGVNLGPAQQNIAGEVFSPPGSVQYQQPTTSDIVSVTKTVDFLLIDYYAGSGIASANLQVWEKQGDIYRQLDNLTTASDGTIATTAAWPSGKTLYIRANDGSNSLQWFEITVPQMGRADAEALSVNGPITLYHFDYTAPTISVRDSAGNTYSDTGNLNITSGATPGTSSVVITVTWFEGTDNDGYMASYDPVNSINWKSLLVVKFSGTNYELVSVSGFDKAAEKGSAIYYASEITPTSLTKWKQGNDYVLPGTGSYTYSLDLSGYSGDAADMDIYIYFYSDWDYFLSRNSWGPNSLSVISGAPHTVNLID